MVKGLKIGAVVALVITLTSCSNSGSAQTENEPVGFANVQPETDATPEASATPEPEESDAATVEPTLTEQEAAYLELVRTRNDLTEISATSDTDLIALGNQACVELAATPDENALRLFADEQPNPLGFYNASATVGVFAGATICPGLIPPQAP